MKKTDETIAEFDAWLEHQGLGRMGVPRSILHGILLLAGAGPVGREHIEEAKRLARESGADSETLLTLDSLGERFLRFQANRSRGSKARVSGTATTERAPASPKPTRKAAVAKTVPLSHPRPSTSDEIAAMLDDYCDEIPKEPEPTPLTEDPELSPSAEKESVGGDELKLSETLEASFAATWPEAGASAPADSARVRESAGAAEGAAAPPARATTPTRIARAQTGDASARATPGTGLPAVRFRAETSREADVIRPVRRAESPSPTDVSDFELSPGAVPADKPIDSLVPEEQSRTKWSRKRRRGRKGEGEKEPKQDPATAAAAGRKEPVKANKGRLSMGRRPMLLACAAAGMANAGGAWCLARSDDSGPAPRQTRRPRTAQKPPRPAKGVRLVHVGLDARLPPGWQHAEDHDRIVMSKPLAGNVRTSLFYRGGSLEYPDHGLMVGTAPIPPAILDHHPFPDEALLAVGQEVEASVAEQARQSGTYRREQCAVAEIGEHRTAVCTGKATRASATSTLRTYVRMHGKRAVIALFMSSEPGAGSEREADTIFASLR